MNRANGIGPRAAISARMASSAGVLTAFLSRCAWPGRAASREEPDPRPDERVAAGKDRDRRVAEARHERS